jgi:hypothetical protein
MLVTTTNEDFEGRVGQFGGAVETNERVVPPKASDLGLLPEQIKSG